MKKNITVIFFFNALFFCKYAVAQSCDSFPYQHIYYNKGFHDTRIRNFSFTANDDIYLTGFAKEDATGNNTDCWIMRTTFHGTPLWSKVVGTPSDEEVNGVRNTKDGGFIFAGTTKYNSLYETGWIAKIDSSGQP